MATQPQAASTNPAANIPEDFGIAQTGKQFTAASPEVQAFQTETPGMTTEAAIGSAILQEERAKPSMLSSRAAEERIAQDTARLDQAVVQRQPSIRLEDFSGFAGGLSQQQNYENALARQAGQPEPHTRPMSDREQADLRAQRRAVEGQVVTPDVEFVDDPIVRSLKTLQDTANEANAALIRGIQAKYARRKEQQRDISKRRQAGLTLIGQRAGRQRYAPEIQEGILGAEERAGIQALADLDAEEEMLVAQARQAKLDQDFKALSQMMGRFDQLQRQKTQKAQDVFNKMVTQEKLALDKGRFEMEKVEYLQQQDDRIAETLASSLVNLDPNLDVMTPDMAQINEVAQSYGLNPTDLLGFVNQRSDEMKKLSREERAFRTSQKLADLNIQGKELANQRSVALLPYEMQQKLLDLKTGEVQLDRLQFLTDKEKRLLPFELQLKGLQIEQGEMNLDKVRAQLQEMEREARSITESTGQLSVKQLDKLDKTPQVKKLQTLKGLKTSLIQYKDLVDKYGTARFSPTQIKLLDQARADAVIAWKEAAALGALTGPDLELIEKAIPRATAEGYGPIDQLTAPILNAPILRALEQSIGKADADALREVEGIKARGQHFYDNDYMRSIISPFLDEKMPTMYHNLDVFNQTATTSEKEQFGSVLDDLGIDKTDQGAIEEALREYSGGFSDDLGKETSLKDPIEKIATAIGQFESGGNYSARGPVVPSGRYKGERAAGKYQVMPGNLPQWSRQALGREVSLEEFMASPDIQDKIAKFQFQKNYDKYGNVEDVASVWFTGQPLAKARTRRDVLGTTGEQYARNVKAIFENLS